MQLIVYNISMKYNGFVMIDLPKLTPIDKDKMPVSIDAKHIHLVHTPWFVANTIDKIKAGSTPSPSAVGADNWAIQDKDIVVEDDWLKTKPCPYISKMSAITVSNSITFTGAIEFTLFDYSKPTLKEAEVKRVSTLAVQTVNVLVKNQVAYIIMDAKGVLSVESTMPIGVLAVQSNFENQKFLISTVLKDNNDNIVNVIHVKTPAHPTHKHFPGQLNWLLTKIGIWQRNIIPEIIGARGQAGTHFMRAADAHGAFIGGLTRNPRPDDLSGSGFSHIAIPVKVASNAFVSVVSRDDHKTYISQKGMPNIDLVKRYANNQAISTGNMVLHPIFVKPRNYYVNYNNPAELEFIIVITDNPGVHITGGVKPWMLEKSLSDTVVQPSVRDFAALCGFLIVKANDTDIVDTNIVTASQNFSAVNKHITPMPVIQADALPIAVAINDKIKLSGLNLLENGVMPYISALKGIKYGYIPRNPMKKAVLSYRSATNAWILKPLNYTLSQVQINDFNTNSKARGFICLQPSRAWIQSTIGVLFPNNYDFLAKIFNVNSQADIKFSRQNVHVKYRPKNKTIDYLYNSNAFDNLSPETYIPFSTKQASDRPSTDMFGRAGNYIFFVTRPNTYALYGGFFTVNSPNSNRYDYTPYFIDDKNVDNLLPRINLFPSSGAGVSKLTESDKYIAVSSVLNDFQGEQEVDTMLKNKINTKQFLQDTKYNNTSFFTTSNKNKNYNITFLNNAPEALKLNNINIDETKKITNNYPYLARLKNTGIPVLSNIILSLITDSTGSNTFTFNNTALFIVDKVLYGTRRYHFGAVSPPAAGFTTITPQNLDIDITIEAAL